VGQIASPLKRSRTSRRSVGERDPAKREARKAEIRHTAADPQICRSYLLRTVMIAGVRAAAAIG